MSRKEENTKSDILIIGSRKEPVLSIRKALKKYGLEAEYALKGSKGLEMFRTGVFSLILLESSLPDMTGRELIKELNKKGTDVSFIVIAKVGEETIAVDMMKLGARDILVKDENLIENIPKVVKRVFDQIRIERRLAETEKRLKEGQRSISNLLKNLPGMAYRCKNDEERTLLYSSEGSTGITGYHFSDLSGISYTQFIDPLDRDYVLNKLKLALDEKEPFSLTYRIHTIKGEERWVLEKGSGIYSEDGEREEIEGFIMDITQQKKAEDALQSSEDKYRNLIERSNDGIVIIQNDLFKFVNNRMAQIFGYEVNEMLNTDFSNYISPEFMEIEVEGHEEVIIKNTSNVQYETRAVRSDGEILTVLVNVGPIEYEGKPADFVFIKDITARKKAEEELMIYRSNLEEKTKQLEKLIEESPIATISTDLYGRVKTVNKSAKRLLKDDNCISRPISSILGQEIEMINKDDFSIDLERTDGIIPLNVSTALIEEGSETRGMIVTLKDLSEISGLIIKPVEEESIDTDLEYNLDSGIIYFIDSEDTRPSYDIFIDLVRHGKPGLCVSRQNSRRIKKEYGLLKTPVIWLTRNEMDGMTCIHPSDIFTKLQSTLINFIKDAKDGIILIDGLEYLVSQNDFEMVLKFIQAINDDLMVSSSRLLIHLDSNAMRKREFHSLKKEMKIYVDLDMIEPFL
ncbi:MAG: PAS domain S-box protein [Halobacteriota archaeon]|nr:PAS domain S-box protein [Halobacteriota archaeon]